MSITIYQLEHSPYCIPITAALTSLGVRHKTVNVPNDDRTKIIKLTNGAYYQVPVLVDGRDIIFESGSDTLDVARWVDRKHAAGRLFPAETEGLQRLLVPYIENEVEGTSFKLTDPRYLADIDSVQRRVKIVRHKERKFGRGCVEAWRKQAPQLRRELEKLLLPFDLMAQHSPFLLGESPVFADFALLGILGNLTFRGYNKIPPRLRSLAEWEKRLRAFRYQH